MLQIKPFIYITSKMNSLLYLLLATGAAAAPRSPTTRPALSLRNITRMSMEMGSRDLSGPQMGGVNFPDPTLIWGDGS